jgi:hypothetical protein
VVLCDLEAVEEEAELTPRVPLRRAKLSYAAPGCRENGFNPPSPNGEYKRLGLGKKNGNELGRLVEAEDTGVPLFEVSGFLGLLICLDVLGPVGDGADSVMEVAGVEEVTAAAAAAAAASIPAKEGSPSPARLANKELVRLMLPSPLIPLNALMLGIPPKGKRSGFFGSNPPNERLESSDGLMPPSEGNCIPEAWLTLGDEPGGLDNRGGLPGPFLSLVFGSLFCRSCGRLPLSFTNSAHLGSTSNMGFSNSHCASLLSCGALEPVN